MSENACVFAVPQGFAVTLDGGSSWVNTTLYSSLPVPGGLAAQGVLNSYLAGVTCPSARACFVTVEVLKRSRGYESSTTWLFSTRDAGRTWTRGPIGPLTVRATGLSLPMFTPGSFACADVLHCVLVVPADSRGPARVLETADGGATFAVASAPTAWGHDQIGVTCVGGLHCWALPASEGQQAERGRWTSLVRSLSTPRRNSLRCGPVPLRRPDSREWDLRVPKRRAVCCHRLPPELGSPAAERVRVDE
jgi:hypothetical protein